MKDLKQHQKSLWQRTTSRHNPNTSVKINTAAERQMVTIIQARGIYKARRGTVGMV